MKKAFLFLLLIIIVVTSLSAAKTSVIPDPISPLDYDSLPEPEAGVHHYLLVCYDIWSYDEAIKGNSDGISILTMDTNNNRLIFTTISRETLVLKPNDKIGRITYIAKLYGPEALCEIVSTHFGIKIEKYIFFRKDNIENLIDAFGGVYITVTNSEADYLNNYRIKRDATEPSMDKAGTYWFSGHAALVYMMIRKVYVDGYKYDFSRNYRIRKVLKTLVQENRDITLSEAVNIVYTLSENVYLTNMTMNDLMTALACAYKLKTVDMEDFQLPMEGTYEYITYLNMQTTQADFEANRSVFVPFINGE